MTAPTVIFDLDGTLIDTAPDLMASLNHVLTAGGLAAVGYDKVTWLVGQGARAMIERGWALHGHEGTPAELDAAFTAFLDHYGAAMPGDSVAFPGLVEALDRLSAAGFTLAVCTNKSEAMALRLLEMLGLRDRFAAVTGGDTFAVRKPHGDHILKTIERAGGVPASSVMVGDSVNDILAAKNAGIASIGVPFGYTAEPIETFDPDCVIQHFAELDAPLVERLIAGRTASLSA